MTGRVEREILAKEEEEESEGLEETQGFAM